MRENQMDCWRLTSMYLTFWKYIAYAWQFNERSFFERLTMKITRFRAFEVFNQISYNDFWLTKCTRQPFLEKIIIALVIRLFCRRCKKRRVYVKKASAVGDFHIFDELKFSFVNFVNWNVVFFLPEAQIKLWYQYLLRQPESFFYKDPNAHTKGGFDDWKKIPYQSFDNKKQPNFCHKMT